MSTTNDGQLRQIVIPAFRREVVEARIQGTAPLICRRYSETEREKMENAQRGAARTKKPPREPEREFREAQYRFEDGGHGFPSIGIKKAMVLAGQRFADEKGTELYGAFRIQGELLRLDLAAEPRMRTDRVVLSGPSRTASLAYRPEYWPWEIVVPLSYNANFISLDQLINLLTTAGEAVGIGEWRVEKKGNFGTFEVADVRQVVFGG